LSPLLVVLAITAEEPGSVAEIQRRASDLFPSAYFSKTAAHSNLPSLARKRWVKLIEKGEQDSQNRYEVTELGLKKLRQWITRDSPVLPAMREAIHGKLEFATRKQLGDLIILSRAEAVACQITSDDAHRRMLTEQRRRVSMRRNRRRTWEDDLDDEMSQAHLEDVKLMWEDIAERRRKLADRLEAIYKRHADRIRESEDEHNDHAAANEG